MARTEEESAYDVDILQRIEDSMLNDPSVMGRGGSGEPEESAIQKFYKDKCILVTGGTGFLGKALVEKLLRACPDISVVYMLIRSKKGKDVQSRLDDILDDPLFQALKKSQPNFRQKLTAVEGDISVGGLGLSPADRRLLADRVDVIFHGAATVRFDEKLKAAVDINVRGTKCILELAAECAKLASLTYISTAYSNCTNTEIKEEFYKPPMSPKNILDLVDFMPEEKLDQMTRCLVGEFPNTYCFSKAIAEGVVQEYGSELPMCVFRPSIVIATYKEPIRGWSDNLFGPTGVLMGAGTGLLATLHCDRDIVADLVPVDMVVNGLITCGWWTALEAKERLKEDLKIPIYNYVSCNQSPITWGSFLNLNKKYGMNYPTMNSVWYYRFTINKYYAVHFFYTLLFHFLPAFFVDGYCCLTGRKPRLTKLYRKIENISSNTSYFTCRQWKFANENVIAVWSKTGRADRQLFNMDLDTLDWDEHSEEHILGLRINLLKDPETTIPEAKVRWERFRIVNLCLQVTAALIALRILWGLLSCALSLLA